MNRYWVWSGVALLAASGLACGEAPGTNGASGTSSGGAAGSGGSSAGMPQLMLGGSATVAPIPLQPAAGVDLEACKAVTAGAIGECLVCCVGAGLPNSGFFQGTCACRPDSPGGDVCATQGPEAPKCFSCCAAASFSRSSFSPGPPTRCGCNAREDATVCAKQASDENCGICCINAGFVSHVYGNGCGCSDG